MPRTSPPFSIDSAARRLAGALLFISKPSRSWSPSVEKTVDPILRHFLQPLSKPLKASLVAAVIDPHLLHHHTLASGLFHWADLQPNFSHTAQTYHSLLKSLSLSRQPQLIPPLLETARGRQVPLYSSSYQIAISSLLLLGKSIEAAELIDSATRSSDEELRASLYNSLLAGLSSDGFLDVARKLLGRMLRRGIIPSVVDFGVFMGQIKTLLDHPEKLLERQTELKTLLEEYEAPEKVVDDESSVATNDWSGDFEWNSRAEDIRFNVFGIPSYRTNQREIINAVMSGKDVLVIMAAGGGKSLCYQLPALLRDGVALVVSPLLSLIQDQVMGLTTLGIPAYMLTSTTSEENEKLIYEALEKGEIELKVLYVTPEKISKSKRFMSTLEKCHHGGRLSLIAIDEAHCCSQWGHDFRPDYKNLGILKIQFPNVPLIALTATATYKVQIDLMEMLHIPKCVKFVSTVNRPNLFYRVREKSSVGKIVIDEIAAFIKGSYSKNDSGIIYCFSRKECEQVAWEMRKSGISANHYHANMRVAAREKVHLLWSTNKLQVVVGTVAFGMGINKPDVRFVIHHSLSKSMETYFQESGRAGRDGLPSDCVLYYRPGDVPRQISMVFYENDGLQNLYDIVRYCQSKRKCRREAFSQHFGEPVQDCNGMCDNCAQEADDVKELDATYHAKVIVSLLHEMQEKDQRATMLQLVERFKLKIKALGRSTQPVSDLKKKEIEQLIVQLLLEHVLKEEFQHKAYATNLYIALGSLWKLVLEGRKQVMLEVYTRRQRNGMTKKRNRLSGLEVKLDELREELSSNNAGILPHAILSSQQISTLSSQRPTSMSHLEKLIGKVKTEKYGKRIIEATQKYLVPELADNDVPVAAKGSKQGGNKKRKNKLLVVVESSEDEQ